ARRLTPPGRAGSRSAASSLVWSDIMNLTARRWLPVAGCVIASVTITAQQSAGPQAPMADKKPHPTTIHGRKLKDDYFWLRDKSNPDVIKSLEAENAYTERMMQDTKGLQET